MRKCFHCLQKVRKYRTYSKDFKLLIAERMTGSFVSRENSFPNSRPSKRSRKSLQGPDPPSHMTIFLESPRRCTMCSINGLENRTFVLCSTCDVSLCLLKGKKYSITNTVFYNTYDIYYAMIICSL